MNLTKLATVTAVFVAYVCSISFGVTGALAKPPFRPTPATPATPATPTFASNNISGTVKGPDNQPFKNQTVQVFDSNGNWVKDVMTDGNGNVVLNGLSPGSYTISAGGATASLQVVATGTVGVSSGFVMTTTKVSTTLAATVSGLANVTALAWGGGIIALGGGAYMLNRNNKQNCASC